MGEVDHLQGRMVSTPVPEVPVLFPILQVDRKGNQNLQYPRQCKHYNKDSFQLLLWILGRFGQWPFNMFVSCKISTVWGRHPFCRTFPLPLNNLCLPADREFLVLAKDVCMKEALTLQFLKCDGRIIKVKLIGMVLLLMEV